MKSWFSVLFCSVKFVCFFFQFKVWLCFFCICVFFLYFTYTSRQPSCLPLFFTARIVSHLIWCKVFIFFCYEGILLLSIYFSIYSMFNCHAQHITNFYIDLLLGLSKSATCSPVLVRFSLYVCEWMWSVCVCDFTTLLQRGCLRFSNICFLTPLGLSSLLKLYNLYLAQAKMQRLVAILCLL